MLGGRQFCLLGTRRRRESSATVRSGQLSCRGCGLGHWGRGGLSLTDWVALERRSADTRSRLCRVECRQVDLPLGSGVIDRSLCLLTLTVSARPVVGGRRLWTIGCNLAEMPDLDDTIPLVSLRLAIYNVNGTCSTPDSPRCYRKRLAMNFSWTR